MTSLVGRRIATPARSASTPLFPVAVAGVRRRLRSYRAAVDLHDGRRGADLETMLLLGRN